MLQETVVYHDPLAAWFYKCDEGSGGTEEHDVVKAADNAGEGLALLCRASVVWSVVSSLHRCRAICSGCSVFEVTAACWLLCMSCSHALAPL